MSIPTWGTIDQAAAIYAVQPRTIRNWIASGDIVAKRFGPRLIRVDLESIERAGRPLQYVGGDAA